jgi:hypothetical protein
MKYYTSSTQFNCGIDLHARQRYVCLMDRDGTKSASTPTSKTMICGLPAQRTLTRSTESEEVFSRTP